jgi:tRNA (guanosine-2'-O-)-methyltransferase
VGAVDLVYTNEEFPRISDMAAGYTKRWALLNKHTSIEDCYGTLRARGLRIIATGPAPGQVPYTEIDWTKPTALVIGHERHGCSEYALEHADQIVIIPMIGFAQSLNVSVATAVLLAEIARQRRAAGMFEGSWSSWHDETIDQWAARDEMGLPWKPIWPPEVPSPEGDD